MLSIDKGGNNMRKLLCMLAVVCMVLGLSTVAAEPVKGTASYVVEGFENGPAVTKVVVKTDAKLDSIDAADFAVTESKNALNWAVLFAGAEGDLIYVKESPRSVVDAYYSDSKGNKVSSASGYVAVELGYNPTTEDGNPYFYDFAGTGHNDWCNPYELSVTYKGEAMELTTSSDKWIIPQLDVWNTTGKFKASDGTNLTYASYTPAKDAKKNPLFIWLHGAGEGGTNPEVVVLGNEVSALAGSDFQSALGGAYILAPQCETYWMDSGSGQIQADGKTMFTKSLMELIETYVKNNSDIDTDRIYIGGCSNGGFMTMNMLFNYPDYFAAAVPICEAYPDAAITDEMLESIKDIPIWMIAAATDTTVDPTQFILPTYERLSKISTVAKKSYFDAVLDLSRKYDVDGVQYEYMGHYSWVYFFNNEVNDGSTNLYKWLGAQKKTSQTTTKPVEEEKPIIKDTADQPVNYMGFFILLVSLIGAATLSIKKTAK